MFDIWGLLAHSRKDKQELLLKIKQEMHHLLELLEISYKILYSPLR